MSLYFKYRNIKYQPLKIPPTNQDYCQLVYWSTSPVKYLIMMKFPLLEICLILQIPAGVFLVILKTSDTVTTFSATTPICPRATDELSETYMQTEPPYSLSGYLFFLLLNSFGTWTRLSNVFKSQFYSWIVARNKSNTIGKAFSLEPDT